MEICQKLSGAILYIFICIYKSTMFNMKIILSISKFMLIFIHFLIISTAFDSENILFAFVDAYLYSIY